MQYDDYDDGDTILAISWIRRLVASISTRMPGFTPRSVNVGIRKVFMDGKSVRIGKKAM
jgi:hypothetical protein